MEPARRVEQLAQLAATLVATLGVTILVVQAVGLTPLQVSEVDLWTMAPATPIAFLLGGVALALTTTSKPHRRAVASLTIGMAVVVLLGLSGPLFGVRRPSFNTVAAFLLLAPALGSLDSRRPIASQGCALGAMLIAALAVAGYVYHVPVLYQATEDEWGMALATAIGVLGLSIGLLCARPRAGLMAAVTSEGPGGRTLRRLLPAVIAAPLFALLLEEIARSDIRALELLAALFAVAGMALAAWLSFSIARLLAREAALQERLTRLVKTSEDPIIDTSNEGLVLRWNPAAERLYGYREDEIVGRPITTVIPPEQRDELMRTRAEVLATGRSRAFEGLRLRKDGSRFVASTTLSRIVDEKGRTIGISAITRDLTARFAAEDALRRAREAERRRHEALEAEHAWIESVIEQLPGPLVLLDPAGRIKQMNRAAFALCVPDRGEIDPFGNPILFDVRRPSGEPLQPEELPLVRLIRTGQPIHGEEFAIRTDSGALLPVMVNAAPVRDPQGRRIGAVLAPQDISAIKQLERMREEWTSIIAHDLRQPVNVIMLNATAQPDVPEPTQRALARIQRASEQLRRMIDDLLDMSRLEAHQLRLDRARHDLGTLVTNIVEQLSQVTAPHRVELRRSEGSLEVLVDPGRIGQVLGNLLSNAAKYAFPDTDVVVEVRGASGEVVISVRNHGPGIAADEIPRLFDRFSRTRAARGSGVPGLGLGLFISRGLVEAHGGRIWVESIPDRTTTFYVALPRAEQARAFEPPQPRAPGVA